MLYIWINHQTIPILSEWVMLQVLILNVSRPARWINSSNLGRGWDPLNSDSLEGREPLGRALFSRRKEKESLYSAITIAVNHCSPQHPLPSAWPVYWKARPYFLHPGHWELSSLAEGKATKAGWTRVSCVPCIGRQILYSLNKQKLTKGTY